MASDPTRSPLPFGSDPQRGRGPLLLWASLYALWFACLLFLALHSAGAV